MKDTIILFDNTKDDKGIGKIQGSYGDIIIAYTILIYHIAIKNKKEPEDVVLDILYKVKDNETTLYKKMKKLKNGEIKNERKNKKKSKDNNR